MDFRTAFTKLTNSRNVAYPDSEMTFKLLPKGHPDVWKSVQNTLPLSDLNKLGKLEGVEGDKMVEALSAHYETLGEFTNVNLRMLAAHIEGWEGLTDGGQPMPYSPAKAYELLLENEPFADWIADKAAELGVEYEAELEKTEDAKKK